ncbi:MAG: hypothetical protein NVS1B10_06440 [Candidatus Saccharimonadales bacterium]
MSFIRWSATSSGELSASSQITTTGGYLHGFELNPPASGQATLKIYDSNAAGTTKLISTATTAAGLASVYVEFPAPRTANSGIYAVLTGTTTYAIGYSLG